MSPGLLSVYQKNKFKKKITIFLKSLSVYLAIFVFFLGVVSFISHLDYLTVNRISVEGNRAVSEIDILNIVDGYLEGRHLGMFSKQNIMFLPVSDIEDDLRRNFFRIKDISLKKEMPDGLLITVVERKPHALWCIEGDSYSNIEYLVTENIIEFETSEPCWFLDSDGYAFSHAPSFSDSVYFQYFDTSLDRPKEDFHFLPTKQFKELEDFILSIETLNLKPVFVIRQSADEFHMYLSDGSFLNFSFQHSFNDVFYWLGVLLQEKKDELIDEKGVLTVEYIDLRFGNRIFYMPK